LPRTLRAARCHQRPTENLEVHNSPQSLQWITRRAQRFVPVRKIEETGCPAIITSATSSAK
jgi:hypothetical protein